MNITTITSVPCENRTNPELPCVSPLFMNYLERRAKQFTGNWSVAPYEAGKDRGIGVYSEGKLMVLATDSAFARATADFVNKELHAVEHN